MRLNHLWYRLKYNHGQFLPLSVPVDLTLELSSHCSLHCHYCYHSKENAANLPFKKGFMSFELAVSLLQQAACLGVNSLKFNARGEGTLHPQYMEIAKYAKSLSRGSTFLDRIANTNIKFGYDREDLFQGLCAMTKVKISFDSFQKEVLEKQRTGAKFEHLIRNIDKLYNYPGRDNTLVIQAVRTNLNKDEDLEGEIKKRWPAAEASIRDVVTGRNQSELKELAHRKRNFSQRQPCKQAFVRMIVHHDGKVSPCCPDIAGKLIIGDATRQTVSSIFNSHIAKKLREDLKSKKAFLSNPCLNCSSYESYKGYEGKWNS